MAPMLYSVSTFHCMTVSLALDGAGLGTMWGEQKANEMFRAGGVHLGDDDPHPRGRRQRVLRVPQGRRRLKRSGNRPRTTAPVDEPGDRRDNASGRMMGGFMSTRRSLCVVALILVPFLVTSCVWITRSSVPASSVLGTEGNRESGRPSLSQTGRFVAFDSTATNLVANDTNGVADVFVRDHRENTTERVSVTTDGAQANGASRKASISDDGRFVAFETDATNLTRAGPRRPHRDRRA